MASRLPMLQSDWLVSDVSEEPDMLRSSPPADGQYEEEATQEKKHLCKPHVNYRHITENPVTLRRRNQNSCFWSQSRGSLPVLLRWDSMLRRFSSSWASWFSLSSELVWLALGSVGENIRHLTDERRQG